MCVLILHTSGFLWNEVKNEKRVFLKVKVKSYTVVISSAVEKPHKKELKGSKAQSGKVG